MRLGLVSGHVDVVGSIERWIDVASELVIVNSGVFFVLSANLPFSGLFPKKILRRIAHVGRSRVGWYLSTPRLTRPYNHSMRFAVLLLFRNSPLFERIEIRRGSVTSVPAEV